MLNFFETRNKTRLNLLVGEKIKVKLYDQYKNSFSFEGVCLNKRRVLNSYSIVIYNKTKGVSMSFLLNSPFVVGVYKKKLV